MLSPVSCVAVEVLDSVSMRWRPGSVLVSFQSEFLKIAGAIVLSSNWCAFQLVKLLESRVGYDIMSDYEV